MVAFLPAIAGAGLTTVALVRALGRTDRSTWDEAIAKLSPEVQADYRRRIAEAMREPAPPKKPTPVEIIASAPPPSARATAQRNGGWKAAIAAMPAADRAQYRQAIAQAMRQKRQAPELSSALRNVRKQEPADPWKTPEAKRAIAQAMRQKRQAPELSSALRNVRQQQPADPWKTPEAKRAIAQAMRQKQQVTDPERRAWNRAIAKALQEQSKPQPQVHTPSKSARAAAQQLSDFATKVLLAGQGWKLGVKDKPSDTVRVAQEMMGNIVADGIYGPATRRRMQELGVTAPVRR